MRDFAASPSAYRLRNPILLALDVATAERAVDLVQDLTPVGGTIVSDQSYSEGDQDFKAQLTVIKTKKPQLIMVPGYYTEVGLIARQARELGITVPMLGGDGWVSDRLLEIAQDALNGSFLVNHYCRVSAVVGSRVRSVPG